MSSSLSKYEHICHPLFLIASGGFNFPPLVFGTLGILESWCPYFSSWLVGNTAVAALNLVMTVYCVRKIRRSTRRPPGCISRPERGEEATDAGTNPKSDSETDSNSNIELPTNLPLQPRNRGCCSRLIHYRTPSSDRIRHLLCYDGIITTYAIVFIVWIFWLSEGLERMNREDSAKLNDEEDFDGCLASHERYMRTSLVCGFAFFGFVVVAGITSVCAPKNAP